LALLKEVKKVKVTGDMQKMENNENQKKPGILSKIKFWQISSVVLLILFIVSLMANFSGSGLSGAISKDDAQNKVQQYANIVTGGAVVEVGGVLEDEESGLYKVPLTVRGQTMNGYVTKDGNLFFPAAVNLADFFDQVDSLGDEGTQLANEPVQTAPIDVSVDDDPILGKEDAPVTMVEFSDYQCPFCGRFEKDAFGKIKEEYIDTGKVKLIFRDFPLTNIHPYAQKAAEASECADEQGKFWKYHDILFENQEALTVDDLKKYADDLNLNNNKFEKCLDSGDMEKEVQKDTDDGINYGVTGTPAFFINGIVLEGAQPFENFKQIIDEELSKIEDKVVGVENGTK